jgi:hypothetical protein
MDDEVRLGSSCRKGLSTTHKPAALHDFKHKAVHVSDPLGSFVKGLCALQAHLMCRKSRPRGGSCLFCRLVELTSSQLLI